MKKLIPIILIALSLGGIVFIGYKIDARPPAQIEFHCYTDDTLTWRAIGVSGQEHPWCRAGTCRIPLVDSRNPVYYHPAAREYCQAITIQ